MSDGAAQPVMTPVQMVSATDIQQAASPSLLEGVQDESVGAVYFPDRVLLARIGELEGDGQALFRSWARSHSFLIAPFSIGVKPNGSRIPERVDVSLALDSGGDLSQSPLITGIFPPNGFRKSAFQGEASLGVSAGGELVEGVGGEAKLGLSYSYAPAYASVFSGFASAHAFWQFSRTQDSYPVGDIPMKLLLVLPKAVQSRELIADFDVKVQFTGGIFARGAIVARFTSVFVLP